MVEHVNKYVRKGPEDYPGSRPSYNYITDGSSIYAIPEQLERAIDGIGEFLSEKGLPGLEDRIPVLAYGANASPGSLVNKLGIYEDDYVKNGGQPGLLTTVPGIWADMPGYDVVWRGEPGLSGYGMAELYWGNLTPQDQSTQVLIQYLTKEQLAIVHTTEGVKYGVTELRLQTPEGKLIRCIAYVARDSSVLLGEDGLPLLVKGVRRSSGDERAVDVDGAVNRMLQAVKTSGVLGALGVEAFRSGFFDKDGKKRPLDERTARRDMVASAAIEESISLPYIFPGLAEDSFGRANFHDLPRGAYGQIGNHIIGGKVSVGIMQEEIARLKGIGPIVEKIKGQAGAELNNRMNKTNGI